MIISKTPFRASLFGGGTDYPQYFNEHGGNVLGFAIDKFCYIMLRRLPGFFEYRHRIVWSGIELVNTPDEIKHPAVREILKVLQPEFGLSIHHEGDLPARSGLGSSSSFVVGLLNALHALNAQHATKEMLALEAIAAEQGLLGENVGCQDQVFAAYGGFNHIAFRRDGSFDVWPVIVPGHRLGQLTRSFMLFFTGVTRFASDIAGAQLANFDRRQNHLKRLGELVADALAVLNDDRIPLDELGLLLNDGWRLKKNMANGVSTEEIDRVYAAALDAGAVGGKLLGAGGGGFLLLFVPPHRQDEVRQRLRPMIEVPFDISREGSRIIVYEQD